LLSFEVYGIIKELLPKVKEIQWTVAEGNTQAIKVYGGIVKSMPQGNKETIPDGYKYTIKGNKK
jgi:hypothetical protein